MRGKSVQSSSGFFVGQTAKFKGADHRGSIMIEGTISRLDLVDNILFAAVQCDVVYDRHCGKVEYCGMDVTRRIQLTGDLVNVLHGRPVRHLITT